MPRQRVPSGRYLSQCAISGNQMPYFDRSGGWGASPAAAPRASDAETAVPARPADVHPPQVLRRRKSQLDVSRSQPTPPSSKLVAALCYEATPPTLPNGPRASPRSERFVIVAPAPWKRQRERRRVVDVYVRSPASCSSKPAAPSPARRSRRKRGRHSTRSAHARTATLQLYGENQAPRSSI